MVFKDQSLAVAQKVQREKAQGQQPRLRCGTLQSPTATTKKKLDLEFEPTLCFSSSISPGDSHPSTDSSLMLHPEDVAANFFVSFYIPESSFSYFGKVLENAVIDATHPALLSAGLAVLSQQLRQPRLLRVARKYYSQAITSTNEAIASSTLATHDATLVSVLLLGVFEAQSFNGRASPESWTAHTYGAAALLELRGLNQFDTELGRALFSHVAINIRTSCVQRRARVPPGIQKLQTYKDAVDTQPTMDPRATRALKLAAMDRYFHIAMDRVSQWLFDIPPSGVFEGDLAPFIETARGIDADILTTMTDDLQVVWPTEILPPNEAPEYAFEKVAHRYPSQAAARTWKHLRLMRLFLNDWICQAALAMQLRSVVDMNHMIDPALLDRDVSATDYIGLASTAKTNVTSMTREILGSVPCFLAPSSVAMSVRHLIWPLSLIAIGKTTPAAARAYATTMLQTLATEYGLSQAAAAVDMVNEKRPDAEDWWVDPCLVLQLLGPANF